MGIVVYFISFMELSYLYLILIQILVGIVVYCGHAILFRVKSFYYMIDVIKEI